MRVGPAPSCSTSRHQRTLSVVVTVAAAHTVVAVRHVYEKPTRGARLLRSWAMPGDVRSPAESAVERQPSSDGRTLVLNEDGVHAGLAIHVGEPVHLGEAREDYVASFART